jgi:hypothetical protein
MKIELNRYAYWNVHISLLCAMNPAAPDGAPPRRISVSTYICKHRTAPPCLGEALRRGILFEIAWFDDVHGLGEDSRSCTFQQSLFLIYLVLFWRVRNPREDLHVKMVVVAM